jgi:Apea-like HEPN
MTAQTLQRKLKTSQGQLTEVHAIRLHRAISWIKAAEEQEKNQDLRLICLWVAANSLYAMDEARFEAMAERERFADFVDRLVALDTEERLYNLLWHKFSGPVRLLVENKYVYSPFWDVQRGEARDWERGFEKSITDANQALSKKNVNYLLRIVLDRLYVLRNQLIHGGATYKSKINRSQVRDGGNILTSLLPVIIELMIDNPKANWGKIYYPPLD